jgi:hypothetical protein
VSILPCCGDSIGLGDGGASGFVGIPDSRVGTSLQQSALLDHREIVALWKAVRLLIPSDGCPGRWSEFAIRFTIEKSRRDQSPLNLGELLRAQLGFGESITLQFRSI